MCVLELAGYNKVQIRKMGQWVPRSNLFLESAKAGLKLRVFKDPQPEPCCPMKDCPDSGSPYEPTSKSMSNPLTILIPS